MTFPWEAVTAVSTAVTTIVLLLTVLMGKRQVDLLRRSTQLEGVFSVLRELNSEKCIESRRFVLHELESRLKDPQFRKDIEDGVTDEAVHKEIATLGIFEEIGAYVKFGLVDADTIYCQAGARAVRCWQKLQPVVELARKRGGPGVWDSYEALVAGAKQYYRRAQPEFAHPLMHD